MTEVGAFPLPSLPREADTLEVSLRQSVTEWKAELKSLNRSTAKVRTMRAGIPGFPDLPTWQETPSPDNSEASSGAVTLETLSERSTVALLNDSPTS